MTLPKRLLLRLVVWFLLVVGVCIDLFVIEGPTHQFLNKDRHLSPEARAAHDAAGGVAASVYQIPVFQAQVIARKNRLAWQRGQFDATSDTSPPDSRLLREEALAHLIEELLVKVQIRLSPADSFAKTNAARERRTTEIEAGFSSHEEYFAVVQAQGWKVEPDESQLRLAGRWERLDYLDHQLGPKLNEILQAMPDVAKWEKKTGSTGQFEPSEVETALTSLARRDAVRQFRTILRSAARAKTQINRNVLYQGL